MLDLLSGFVTELRRSGLPVSLTEHLDAAEAVKHIPLEDREGLKYALAATLVKSASHWRAFETAFEVFFAVRPGAVPPATSVKRSKVEKARTPRAIRARAAPRARGGPGRAGAGEGMTPEELAELLFKSLVSADAAMMNVVARNAVDRYAGMEPGRPVGGTYYLYRTLRNLDLDGMLERLMEQAQAGSAGGALTDLEERLAQDEYRARIEKFRRAVETEIRRRLVEDRGAERWPGPCASLCPRTSMSCTQPVTSWPCCTGPSSRCHASWPSAWPASVATDGKALWTSEPPCVGRSPPEASRSSRVFATRARPNPRSS